MWFMDIWSTLPTYPCTLTDYGWAMGYDYLEGTSMATPQVAGLAALYAAYRGITQASTNPANPPWSSANGNVRMWQTIQRAAEDIGFTPPGGWGPYYGYGRINALYTLEEADTRLATAGCVTGQVRYAGTPVGNAVVTAESLGYSTEATSRSDGMYRLTNLPPDSYTVTATVFGQSQTRNDVTVIAGADTPAVSFSVGAAGGPVLSVQPASLTFGGAVGGPNPAAQPLTISNVGTGTLSWSASDDAGWLNLDSTSGTAPSTVWASVNIGGLSAGTYQGDITVTGGGGAQNSPQVVSVTLNVASSPLEFSTFDVSPSFAGAGQVVTVLFSANKALASDPTVTVNGHAATFAWKAGNNYTYQYVVRRDEQEGYAQIVISGQAADGSSGTRTDNSSLLVDLTKPSSSIGAMPSWQSSLQFPIPFIASDSRSGIAHVLMYYEPYPPAPPPEYALWTTPANPTGEWASSPIPFTAPGEGYYYFYTRAVDRAGNVEDVPAAPTGSVGVDTTPPSITSFVINGGVAQTMLPQMNLTLAAQDSASGVSGMRFYYPGSGGWTAWEPFSASKIIWVSPEGGVKQVKARCRDVAGSLSSEASASISLYTFADVLPSHWAWPPIEAIRTAGITSGCALDPPRFCPSYAITRAQMAVFLCRAAGKGPLHRDTPTFADVPKSDTYYGYIERLADAASWGGVPPTGGCRIEGMLKFFCPYQAVTREQMAKFLCLAAGKSAAATCTGQFVDVGPANSFCTFIERLADAASWPNGPVTVGCTCGGSYPPRSKCYCPKASVTRAEMATFLTRAFGIGS
jgi:hypothetical protein